jgi:hypothetical protein
MFPPGRARLATNPEPTGSLLMGMTTGIVLLTCLVAWTAGVPSDTGWSPPGAGHGPGRRIDLEVQGLPEEEGAEPERERR